MERKKLDTFLLNPRIVFSNIISPKVMKRVTYAHVM